MIEESGLAQYLHIMFQYQHIPPGIVMGLRTANDLIPPGERDFMIASTQKAMEEGMVPVTVRNFMKPKKNEENQK